MRLAAILLGVLFLVPSAAALTQVPWANPSPAFVVGYLLTVVLVSLPGLGLLWLGFRWPRRTAVTDDEHIARPAWAEAPDGTALPPRTTFLPATDQNRSSDVVLLAVARPVRTFVTGGSPAARFILGLAMVGGAAWAAVAKGDYAASAWRGPVKVSQDQLAKAQSPKDFAGPVVQFTYEQAVNTDVVLVETRNGRETGRRVRYMLVQAGDRWFVTEVREGNRGKTLTAAPAVWWQPLRLKCLENVRRRYPQYRLAPFQLDAEVNHTSEAWAMVAIVGFFGVVGLGLMAAPFVAPRATPANARTGTLSC